jgi:transcriptional regulator with XRE-family HTH domain
MSEQADQNLGARLLRWRKGQDHSQQIAVRRRGVAATTWSHWEAGRRLPRTRMLKLLSELTGMSLGRMLYEYGDNCLKTRGDQHFKWRIFRDI